MSSYTSVIRYERAGDKLIPVLIRSEPDHNNVLRAVRVTQLAWTEVPFVAAGAVSEDDLDGWASIEAPRYNSREALLINNFVTPAHTWPEGVPCLLLDANGRARAADELAGLISPSIENAWVQDLAQDLGLHVEN